MIKKYRVLAVIPARGGSQRLPRKNIKPLAGKPLITHAICAALGSSLIDRVIVSTEDKEIAKVAKEHGAEVPFLRPKELASHKALQFDVIHHALSVIESKDQTNFDIVVLIQPTAPLVQTGDIEMAIEKMLGSKTNSCVSVCEISERPEWMYKIENGRAQPLTGVDTKTRSQDFDKAYRLNGAVYVTRREIVLDQKKLLDHDSLSAVVMPRERSIDIDEMIDFDIAELMHKKLFGDNTASFKPSDKIFIIAEAGVNHNGDLDTAKKLIEAAAEAGADAVKFQTYKTESLVSPDAPKAEYQEKNSTGKTQYEMLKELELSEYEFEELKAYCDQKGIVFLSTPFDQGSADFLNKLDVPLFKIGSGDLTNLQLIEKVASYKKPIILSTGMSTMEEISKAVNTVKKTGNNQLVLLHCTSNYPTSHESVNLKAMDTLKNEYGVSVGYSDHTEDLEASIAASALGACVIEKHFTLDKKMPGPDHKASIEPSELARLVKAVRNIEKAIGDGEKKPQKSELNVKQVARKSIFADKDIKKGEKISPEAISIKRPEKGIVPEFFDEVIKKRALRIIRKGEPLLWEDIGD